MKSSVQHCLLTPLPSCRYTRCLDQELISQRYSLLIFFFCCGDLLTNMNEYEWIFRKAQVFVVSNRIGTARLFIDWQSRIFDLTKEFPDVSHSVISRKSVATWWLKTKRLPGAYAVAYASSWSIAHNPHSKSFLWLYAKLLTFQNSGAFVVDRNGM